MKPLGIIYAKNLLHWFIVVTLVGFGTFIFVPEIKAQPPPMSNMQNVTSISSETIMDGYRMTGAYNLLTTEDFGVEVLSNGNLKFTAQISMNTSEYQGTERFFIKKDTRDIYFSEDISVIPEQKTDLYLGTEIVNSRFNSTPHEMNIMAHVMHNELRLPEVIFEYKTREQVNLGGNPVNLKVYNTSSVFYFTT